MHSEETAGRVPSSETHNRGGSIGALSWLAMASVASSAALVTSPNAALFGAPIALGLVDAAVGRVLGVSPQRPVVRLLARVLTAGVTTLAIVVLGVIEGSIALRSASGWLYPVVAIVLGLAWLFGAMGSSTVRWPATIGALGHGALIALLDALTTCWAIYLVLASSASASNVGLSGIAARIVAGAAMGVAMLARALIVGATTLAMRRSAPHGARATLPGILAAIAFVGWLGVAGFACAIAASPIAWSGLGAALVVTIGAVVAEARRRSPNALVALSRASVAAMIAATLGVVMSFVH